MQDKTHKHTHSQPVHSQYVKGARIRSWVYRHRQCRPLTAAVLLLRELWLAFRLQILPMAKKTRLQQKVEIHTVLFTET